MSSSHHCVRLRTYEDVMLSDLSLVDYIAVSKTAQLFLPHTQGRYQMRRFRKALCPIVERLVCSMMMHGRNNGKKLMAVRIVKHAFEIIHLLTDKNPIQVFVDAVKNGGPREDSTRVGSAGVVRRQAVDVSPLRRVNQAIYLICTGARNSAFRNIKSISECLADEIMNCAKESSNSYAIKPLDFWSVSEGILHGVKNISRCFLGSKSTNHVTISTCLNRTGLATCNCKHLGQHLSTAQEEGRDWACRQGQPLRSCWERAEPVDPAEWKHRWRLECWDSSTIAA